MAQSLYGYYKEQGKPLPSVAERIPLAAKYGIANYTGTAEQNNLLLSKLTTGSNQNINKLPPDSLPPGGLTPPTGPTGTQTDQVSDLANMRVTLRAALNEAAQNTSRNRMTQLSGLVEGGAAPSVINAAIGLAQQGLADTKESIFSDAMAQRSDEMEALEAQRKEIEFNPDQYKSAQGGIYDLKNNRWVVNPKPEDGDETVGAGIVSFAGNKIFSETKQVIDGFSLIDDMTPTQQQKVRNDLYAVGYAEEKTPAWFTEQLQNERQQSLRPELVNREWNTHRNLTLYGKKLSSDFFRSLYKPKELEKLAGKEDMDTDTFLGGLEKTIGIYRDSGFTDKEIFRMMTE